MTTALDEATRSRIWATAKRAALEAWTSEKESTATEMLVALRAGLEAVQDTCTITIKDGVV